MTRLALRLSIFTLFLLSWPLPSSARPQAHVDPVPLPCLRPISFPDRWDDASGIPGYMGDSGDRRTPDWRSNSMWDREAFTDRNGNGHYDVGEAYVDRNGNGSYDAEVYHPAHTGYGAPFDVGLEIVLHPAMSGAQELGGYFPVALSPAGAGRRTTSADAYRAAWLECETMPVGPRPILAFGGGVIGPTSQAMRNLIARDPDAYWDSATNSVQGSEFPLSPRIFLLPVFDPRSPISNRANHVVVVKFVAFFAEQMTGQAEVRGRLLLPSLDGASIGTAAGGFVVRSPAPATPETWGRLKAAYR